MSTARCACLALLVGACSREARYEERLASGMQALAAGRHADAVEQLEIAAKLRPESATAYCNLGIAFAAIEETESAITSLLMAKDLLKQDPRPAILLADVLCRAGRCEESRKVLAKLNEHLPGQPNILTHMAALEFRQGKMDAAQSLLKAALHVKPDYAPALYNTAVFKRDHERDAIGALRYFTKYLSVAGDGPYTDRAREASALLRRLPPASVPQHRPGASVPREVTPAPPAAPTSPPVPSLAAQASLAIEKQDYEHALVLLKQATGADTDNANALWQLGALYRDHLDQKDRAIATFREFAEMFPADARAAEVRRAAGLAVRPKPAPPEGISRQQRRVKLRNVWQQALSEHRKKNWDQAAALYEQVLELDDRLGIASYNLGLVYKSKGDFAAAEKAFAQATKQSPAMIKAQYMQAVVQRESGENDRAIATALEVIREDPAHDKAHLLLGLLYRETGQREKAQKHLKRAVHLAPDAGAKEQAQAWLDSTARLTDAP